MTVRFKSLTAKPAYCAAVVALFAIAAVDFWFFAAERIPELRAAIEVLRWLALVGLGFSLWMFIRAVLKRRDVAQGQQRNG